MRPMSILLAADLALARTDLLKFVAVAAFAVGIAALLRVFRSRSIVGPLRWSLGSPLWPVVIGAALATFAWLGVQTAYATFVAAHFGQSHPGPHSLEEMLTPADYAVLSTVPGLVGFLVLLVTDYALSPQLPAQLGLAPQRPLDGLVKGIFASLVILPLVFCGAVLLEVFYNAIHYKPPGAHELLLVMQA